MLYKKFIELSVWQIASPLLCSHWMAHCEDERSDGFCLLSRGSVRAAKRKVETTLERTLLSPFDTIIVFLYSANPPRVFVLFPFPRPCAALVYGFTAHCTVEKSMNYLLYSTRQWKRAELFMAMEAVCWIDVYLQA